MWEGGGKERGGGGGGGGGGSGLHHKLQQGLEDWKKTKLLVLLTLYKVNGISLCKPIYPFHMRTKPGSTRVSGSV